MKLLTVILVTLGACQAGCGGSAPAHNAGPRPAASAQTAAPEGERKDERYAVYDAVLDTFVRPDVRMLVIDNRGGACGGREEGPGKKGRRELDETLDRYVARVRAEVPELSAETVGSYRSKPPVCLSPSFDLKVEYRLMTEKEYGEVFTPERGVAGGWKEFYDRYPGSNGYVSLSDVGFDGKATQALVYASRFGGGTDGVGRYFFLTREAGAWVVRKQVDVWYS